MIYLSYFSIIYSFTYLSLSSVSESTSLSVINHSFGIIESKRQLVDSIAILNPNRYAEYFGEVSVIPLQ